MKAGFVIYVFQGGNCAYPARRSIRCNLQIIGFHQILYDKLLVITGFDICHKYLIWQERFGIFHLVSENISLPGINKVIIYHAPHRSFTGTGHKCNNLNGMLTVKDIIYTIPAAYFYRVDLIYIEVGSGLFNMLLR